MLEKLQTYKLQPTKFYEKGHRTFSRDGGLSRRDAFRTFKGTNPALKKAVEYTRKYMPKCSISSTDHVCKFLLKNFA